MERRSLGERKEIPAVAAGLRSGLLPGRGCGADHLCACAGGVPYAPVEPGGHGHWLHRGLLMPHVRAAGMVGMGAGAADGSEDAIPPGCRALGC